MRNAALMLGIIGGLIAMVVGFFGFGYTEVVRAQGTWYVGRVRPPAPDPTS